MVETTTHKNIKKTRKKLIGSLLTLVPIEAKS